MRRALVEDFACLPGITVVMTLDDRLDDEPGPWLTVRVGPGREPSTFARLAASSDYTVVIAPETHGLLSERAQILEEVGGHSLGTTPEAINLTADKVRMARHLASRGIATPETRRLTRDEGLPADFPYPAVLKPISGAGSIDTFLVNDPNACPPEVWRNYCAVLQPFVEGQPMSASFLIGDDARAELVGIGRQWMEIRDGRFLYLGGMVPAGEPDMAATARRTLETVPGLRGWVGVDFFWNEPEERAVVLEINPRLTTSYVGLRRLLPPGALARLAGRLWSRPVAGGGPARPGPLRPCARPVDLRRRRHDPSQELRPMTPNTPSWIALDIGGANLKATHSSGGARAIPFELWKRPDDLPRVLTELTATLPKAGRVAVTMTAELCDCYPTKAKGVHDVLEAVTHVYPSQVVRVWGTDERFHGIPEILAHPDLAAAANWLALATLAARLLPEGPGLLIDIGSTTTDLIPLKDGKPQPRGRTDTQRLRTGELVYAGVRRTPVCALATELPLQGTWTGLSAELFASTMDIYLTLKEIPADPTDLSTADGRPATPEAARDRLARMVGADRDSFSEEDARAFAEAADEALMTRLTAAAERACLDHIGPPRGAVVAGSGEFLARRVARRVVGPDGPIISLEDAWGSVASSAACAYALVVLAAERDGDIGEVP